MYKIKFLTVFLFNLLFCRAVPQCSAGQEYATAGSWQLQGAVPITITDDGDDGTPSITYGLDIFVAVGGSNIATSPDGLSWTTRFSSGRYLSAVSYGSGAGFIAGGLNDFHFSSDGITWRRVSVPVLSAYWFGFAFGNAIFVGLDLTGDLITSSNGFDWTSRGTLLGSDTYSSVAFGAGYFVTVSFHGKVWKSADGINWASAASLSSTNSHGSSALYEPVTFGNGLFLTAGCGPLATSSNAGTSWSFYASQYYCIAASAFGGGMYVLVGSAGALVSTDGYTFSAVSSPFAPSTAGVAYGRGFFVAIDGSGKCMILNTQNGACQNCPVGYYSAAGSSSCASTCPSGYSNPRGSSSCTICAAGMMQGSKQINCGKGCTAQKQKQGCSSCCGKGCTVHKQVCIGTACPAGQYYSASSCQNCPAGNYCPTAGLSAPSSCLAGTYSATSASSCTACTTGTLSSAGSSSCSFSCGAGTALGQGAQCNSCTVGWYQPLTAQAVCLSCISGSYCASTGLIQVTGVCSAGLYSVAGSSACSACSAGTYSASSSPSCALCALGQYQASTGQTYCTGCPAGSYCSITGLTAPNGACSAGSFSGLSSSTCLSCIPGQFVSTAGQAACMACLAGSYCASSGLTAVTGDCLAGSISTSSQSACTSCAAGTFSPSSGQTTCAYCLPGNYCATPGLSSTTLCAAGSVSVSGQTSCAACASGNYQPSSGATICIACPATTFCQNTGQNAATPCPAGFICLGGSTTIPCVAGGYSLTSASTCNSCAAATYQPGSGQSSCINCGAGSYCASTGLTAMTPCPAGSYCLGGAAITGPCQPGQYSAVVGSSACSMCSIGAYEPSVGQASCSVCPAGSYCSSTGLNSVSGTCPAGGFAPAGSTTCSICVTGQYQASTGSGDCTVAEPGKFASGVGLTAFTGICAAGSFAPAGSTSCSRCAQGFYQASTGSGSCTACDPGSYCITTGLVVTSGQCGPGQFSPAGSFACSVCAAGQYSMSSALGACLGCPTGNYQPSMGATSCVVCASATEQPSTGATACLVCQAGTFQPSSGSSACNSCPGGKYCASTGMPAPSGSCGPGEYSLSGAITCSSCLAGNYQDALGSSGCSQCPAGQYSASSGVSACTSCPAGEVAPTSGSTLCRSPASNSDVPTAAIASTASVLGFLLCVIMIFYRRIMKFCRTISCPGATQDPTSIVIPPGMVLDDVLVSPLLNLNDKQLLLADARDEVTKAEAALKIATNRKQPTDELLKDFVEAKRKVQRCQRAVEVARLDLLKQAGHSPKLAANPFVESALAGLDPALATIHRLGRTLDDYTLVEWTEATRPGQSRHLVHFASFDGVNVVLKEFDFGADVSKGNVAQYHEMKRQVLALALIDHPNVAKPQALFFSNDNKKAYLETAFYERGTLDRYFQASKLPRLPGHKKVLNRAADETAISCLRQLASGLAAVHAAGLVHGDLKLVNVLVAKNGMVALTDFDFAHGGAGGAGGASYYDSIGGASSLLGAGTFLWMAPEVRERQPSTSKSDIYGWGLCALLAMLPEAEAEAASELGLNPPAAALQGNINKALALLEAADRLLFSLVRACLDANPAERPTAADVLRHEVFSPVPKARYPAHWERIAAEASGDGFKAHPIKTTDAAWGSLAKTLETDGSLLNVGRDYREPGTHTQLQLARAWRIENPILWHTYRAKQGKIEAEVGRAKAESLRIPILSSRLKASAAALPGATELRADLNEAYLLHGTGPDNVINILSSGLNERYSKVAAFGNGNYLAEDSGKCDQYVWRDALFGGDLAVLHKHLYTGASDHPGPVYYLFLCRTTLGAYLRTVTSAPACVSLDNPSEPIFPTNTRELALMRGVSPPTSHHGLVVENTQGLRFREFLVFHGEYAYPEYLLAYYRR